ncbi:hypothetical protein HDV02_001452 [Globomyces sp. JEL0801]|nr:hypothetical protein HDV02_001452 [Globomyces sp. JEL0801]
MANETTTGKIKITTQLDATNSTLWYFQMQILLEQEQCIVFNESDGDYSWIVANRLHEIEENSKYRICIYLYDTYSGENYSRKFQGIKAIACLTYPGGSVTEYMENTVRLLNAIVVAAGRDEISFL